MKEHNIHAKEFAVGAAVGSLLGSVAAFLIAPKAGKDLREDICDAYCSASDKAHELTEKGRSMAKRFRGESEEDESFAKELLIGGLIGGVVGITAGLLLAPKSGKQLRHDITEIGEEIYDKGHDFAKNTEHQAEEWIELAKSIVENLTSHSKGKGSNWTKGLSNLINNRGASDAINWAHTGYRIWQSLHSKKRR